MNTNCCIFFYITYYPLWDSGHPLPYRFCSIFLRGIIQPCVDTQTVTKHSHIITVGISNKLDHFRFARIAFHFLQCRWLQADDKEIVNIELTRDIIITKPNRTQQMITEDFINPGNMVACNQTTLKWLIFCRVSDNRWFDALNRL